MFFEKLAMLTIEDIRDFLDLNRAEGLHLDYKESHPADWLKIPKDKDEVRNKRQLKFLRHVTAFANAEGGTLIYGIEEHNGVPTGVSPFTEEAPEGAKQHLAALCRNRVEPPLHIAIEFIEAGDDQFVAVVEIPESYAAPHMVLDKNHTDFYQRTSGGSDYMTYDALRQRFARQVGLIERIREFRERRVWGLEETSPVREAYPVAIWTSHPPRYGLHIVPLPRFSGGPSLDFDDSELDLSFPLLRPLYGEADTRWFNLEGMAVFSEQLGAKHTRRAMSYTLVHRNGAIESFNTQYEFDEERPTCSIVRMAHQIAEALTRYAEFYRRNEIIGPFAVFLSIANARKLQLDVEPQKRIRPDRSPLMLPEVVTDNPGDPDACVRPLMTLFFQSLHTNSLDDGWLHVLREKMEGERRRVSSQI